MQVFNFPTGNTLHLFLLFALLFFPFDHKRTWFSRNEWVSVILVSAEIDPQEAANPPTPGGLINVTSPVESLYKIGDVVEVKWSASYDIRNADSHWVLIRVYKKSVTDSRDHLVDQLPNEYRYTSLSANITIQSYYETDQEYYAKVVLSHDVYGTSVPFNVTNSTSSSTQTTSLTPYLPDKSPIPGPNGSYRIRY